MTDLQSIADKLRPIIQTYSDKFQNISETESAKSLNGDKWSCKEILGHLIDSASNNHQRFVRAQLNTHINLPGYQQEEWVRVNGYTKELWSDLIQLWKSYNLHLVHVLEHIPDEFLSNTISLDDKPATTLRFIAEDYVRHLEHHLKQIINE